MTEGRRERTDAARNRRAILTATEDLLTRHRPEQITMEQIARAAGVGKGTVFHRFGSRTGLLVQLMRERAFALNEAVLSGPPPLGPGAPASERLYSFLDAVVDLVSRNKGQLAALGQAVPSTATTSAKPETTDADGTGNEAHDQATNADGNPLGTGACAADPHPIYGFWHDHISSLIALERPDLDADLIGHILLGALQSDPIIRMLERNEGRRLADSLRALTDALITAPPGPTDQRGSHAATRQ
jgi:AcrR family transcriptional regulator